MKWIGQHIWDFVSRFRSDVYLEGVEDGAIRTGGNLGLDDNDKVVKGIGGGGISEEYLASRGENLITNYSGLLGTNYNFPDFTFDGAYSNSSPGSFSITGNSPGSVRTSEFMVVNANKKYKVSVDIKTLYGLGRYYMFTDCYDVDDNYITAPHHMYLTGTTTTLALDLSPGDTEMHLTDASNWYNTGTAGVDGHDRSLLVWGYENSYGYEYPVHTYSRLWYRGPTHATSGYSEDLWTPGSVNTTTNVITLREAWTGPEYKAGRDVSNGDSGATYKYNVMAAFTPSNQVWSHKTGYMDGIDYTGTNVGSKFNPGTAKVKVGFLPNYRTAAHEASNESWAMEETAWVTNLFFGLDYSSSELIIDEDDMASNLDDFVPSQQSVKAYVDANGGGVNVTDNDTSNAFGSTSTITVQGDHVQSFQNGANNVLLNIGTAISTASAFSISTDPTASYATYRIGTPHDSSNKNFYVGDWGGDSSKRATKNSSITFGPSNLAGNMESDSKIVVTVYAPEDNTSSGSSNSIATHTHTVDDNGNSTANGITTTVSGYILDGYEPKRKANITVVIAPGTIAAAIATANSLTNHSGSQKFYRISIAHKSSDLNTTYGTFDSVEFFYDGALVQPIGTDAIINMVDSQTKYLSNIKYYSALEWRVLGYNITNISRDTRGDAIDVRIDFTSGLSDDDDGYQYEALGGNTNNSVNDDENSYDTTWNLDSGKYNKNGVAEGRLGHIYGGLADAGSETNWDSDSNRIWNTYSGGSNTLSESFREEEYRLPDNTISTWNTNSTSSALATWQAFSVSGAMSETSATINNAHDTNKDLLLQVQYSGNTFKLQHPHNVGTLAANPTQDKFTGSAPGTGDKKYYRWFRFSSAVDNFECDISGMTRAQYDAAENSGYINIKFSRPGVNNTFVPLDPDQGYQGGSPEVSCWNADNSETSGPSYISDTNVFKCNFGEVSQVFVMEITMNSSFSHNITSITLS